jgi:hypothetical protein
MSNISNYDYFTNQRRLNQFASAYNKNEEEQYKSFKDRLRHDELLESNSAFWNPKDGQIYFGETKKHTPTYEKRVFDTRKYIQYKKLVDKAEAEGGQDLQAIDHAKYEPWTKEFSADAARMVEKNDEVESGYLTIPQAIKQTAGYMTQADFQGLRLVAVLGQLINQQQRAFSLQNAGTKYTSNNVIFRIPTVTRFQIAEDVRELEGGVEAMKMAFTSQFIQLTKDVAHLAWSDEFMMAEYDQPIMQLHLQNATSEFERVRASKMATQLNLLSANNLSTQWDDYITGADRSSANPIIDIAAARQGVYNANGVLMRAASNTLTYQIYLQNSFIRGLQSPVSSLGNPDARVINGVPGQPGLVWYLDELLADGKIYFWDASALADIQGPIRTSTYRDEEIGGQGIFMRNWNGCFFLRPTQGYLIGNVF